MIRRILAAWVVWIDKRWPPPLLKLEGYIKIGEPVYFNRIGQSTTWTIHRNERMALEARIPDGSAIMVEDPRVGATLDELRTHIEKENL